jgi:16S rRNA (adenine1518-N6/adenine1519-N6)-dimethyltransferase
MTSPGILLKAWNLRAKKALGQNFLVNPATAEMIVERAALSPDDVVLEIGAGLGALTLPAAAKVRAVTALETDADLIALLRPELALRRIDNVTVVHADFLKVDIASLAEAGRLVVMGNLPYNISSQVVVRLIHARPSVSRAVLMLQRELAERLCAAPGGKAYGRLTAMLAYCSEVKRVAEVAASLFFPRPKVDSEVIEIRFHETPPHAARSEEFLFRTIKAAFSQRRKTLRNALMGSELHVTADTALEALKRAGITPSRRAETLAVPEFVALSDALERLLGADETTAVDTGRRSR